MTVYHLFELYRSPRMGGIVGSIAFFLAAAGVWSGLSTQAGEAGHGNHAQSPAQSTPATNRAPAQQMQMPGMTMPPTPSAPGAAPAEFKVPIERQQQFGVTYVVAQTGPLRKSIRTVGLVTYETQRRLDFVSRVEGYVQQLDVSSIGQVVEKGQALLTIYSPSLLSTEQEFITELEALDQARKTGSTTAVQRAEALVESGRIRLQLWNIGEPQIAELERTRKPTETLPFYSPFRGVIRDLAVTSGQRVAVGDRLVDLVDLSVMWVWAEFYQSDVPLLRVGWPVTIGSSAFPGEDFQGKIALLDPFINPATRTTRARIDLKNPQLKLRPDMYVTVEVVIEAGTGLIIPLSAVMPTGRRNLVFLDKGQGRLEPRFVELGGQYGTNYLVTGGLKPGERIVNSANFLIDSEANLQGALRRW